MATLEQIRVGMAAALDTIPELQASAWMLGNPTPPAAHVFPERKAFDQAMQEGLGDLTMKVQVFVATVGDIGPQKLLDRYLDDSGDYSVKAALEYERPSPCRLGGLVQDLHVQGWEYRQFARPQGDAVLGAEFTVQVFT